MRTWIKRLLWFSLTVTLVSGAWAGWAFRKHVVLNPGEHIDKGYILRALSKEDLNEALTNYGKRERRFGKTSEQLTT